MERGVVKQEEVTSGLEIVKGMVKVAGNVTKECALMKVFNAVTSIRQEAEDARRVLAEPAAHRPPVEPGPNDGGCDPGCGLLELSMSKRTKLGNGLVSGRVGIPASKSRLEAGAHSGSAK